MSVKLSHEQYIYDISEFPEMADYSRQSFEEFNRTILNIIYDCVWNKKLSPLTKAYLNDTTMIKPKQSQILKNVVKILKDNQSSFDYKQVIINFETLNSFYNTSYGENLLAKLSYVVKPKIIDWEHLIVQLLNPNFNFKNSKLMEDWFEIGKELERAFQKTKGLEK